MICMEDNIKSLKQKKNNFKCDFKSFINPKVPHYQYAWKYVENHINFLIMSRNVQPFVKLQKSDTQDIKIFS